jgi:hypothetical protein
MIYKTTDLTECVLFKTFNYPYLGAERVLRANGKYAVELSFDIPREGIQDEIMKDYMNHELKVDAYDFMEANKYIRREIYLKK